MAVTFTTEKNDLSLWTGQFDAAELALNGWTVADLNIVLNENPTISAYQDGGIASCLCYQQLAGNIREVLFLATAPSFRRKGLQEALIRYFLNIHSGGELWLECRADNQAALALYKKCGFREKGRRPRYYKDGMDAILMTFLDSCAP